MKMKRTIVTVKTKMTDPNSGAVKDKDRMVFGPFTDTEAALEFANSFVDDMFAVVALKILGRTDRHFLFIDNTSTLVKVTIRVDTLSPLTWEPEGKTEETPTSDGGDCSVEFEPDAEAPEEA